MADDKSLELEELAEQAEEVLSPLAQYLAQSSPDNAAKLSAFASAGLLTLRDVEAALAQEVINMTLLATSTEEDAKKLNELRMMRVQIQRVLKDLAKVVKVGGSGGPGIELTIQWPDVHAGDRGDLTPTDRSQLPKATQERDAQRHSAVTPLEDDAGDDQVDELEEDDELELEEDLGDDDLADEGDEDL